MVALDPEHAKRMEKAGESRQAKGLVDAVAKRRAPKIARNPCQRFGGRISDDDVIGSGRPRVPIQNSDNGRHQVPLLLGWPLAWLDTGCTLRQAVNQPFHFYVCMIAVGQRTISLTTKAPGPRASKTFERTQKRRAGRHVKREHQIEQRCLALQNLKTELAAYASEQGFDTRKLSRRKVLQYALNPLMVPRQGNPHSWRGAGHRGRHRSRRHDREIPRRYAGVRGTHALSLRVSRRGEAAEAAKAHTPKTRLVVSLPKGHLVVVSGQNLFVTLAHYRPAKAARLT
jgi:hypothetical protein